MRRPASGRLIPKEPSPEVGEPDPQPFSPDGEASSRTEGLHIPASLHSNNVRPITQVLDELQNMLSSGSVGTEADSSRWEMILRQSRAMIRDLEEQPDSLNVFGVGRWMKLVDLLQRVAYWHDLDSGGAADVAQWCERQWATVLQSHPQNVPALQGMAQAWLFKSQAALARIYQKEGSPSSSEESSSSARSRATRWPRQDEEAARAAADSERINSNDYTEARGQLRPALESFDRALVTGEAQGAITGELLELAAEAYISFGNVSHPRNNEVCYQKGLSLLLKASKIPGYTMDRYLRAFLEENLELMDESLSFSFR